MPRYSVPSMAEIVATPIATDYRVASTFSGAGGSCLGVRMAGMRVGWANELVPIAQDTYAANHPETTLDRRSIRDVTADDVMQAMKITEGELDVLEGSPPCTSFSMSGKRDKHWGKVKDYSGTAQRSDDLFFEYARLVEGVRPKVFVAENVAGLVRGRAKGYFKLIMKRLKEIGYNVEAKLLDAQWLGVPQRRVRLFIMGVRDDLGVLPVFPEPLSYRFTLRDAIGDLDDPAKDWTGTFESMEGLACGREWRKISPGHSSDVYFNLVRCHWGLPAPTTTTAGGASTAGSAHPDVCRKFTVPELKRINSFPDDYVFLGNQVQQIERIGRCVPPIMMRHVAEAIRFGILDKL